MSRAAPRLLSLLAPAALAFAALGCASPTVQDVDAGDAAPKADAQAVVDTGLPAPDSGVTEPQPDAGEGTDTGVVESDAGEGSDGGPSTPDGGPPPFPIRVAYGASAEVPRLIELYLTDTSTSRTKVNPALAGGRNGGASSKEPETAGLDDYRWVADGERLLYRAQQDVFDVYGLYAADAPGPRPLPTRSLGVDDSDVPTFGTSEASDRIVFVQAVSNMYQVWVTSSSAAAPAPRRLSRASAYDFHYSPASDYVVYQDFIDSMNARDLFFSTVRQDGPAPVQINPGAGIGGAGDIAWAPDGTRFAYIADERANRNFDLFLVPITAGTLGASVVVNDTSLRGTGIGTQREVHARFSPDGSRIAYVGDSRVLDRDELFIVDVSGPVPGPAVVVSSTAATTDSVERFAFDAIGDRMLYATLPRDYETNAVFLADLRGGAPVARVSPVLADISLVGETWARRDSVVIIDLYGDGRRRELYLTDVSGAAPGAPQRLTGETEELQQWSLSPAGDRLVFTVEEAGGAFVTYTLDLSDLSALTPLLLGRGTVPHAACWSPSGGLALAADLDIAGQAELFWIADPGAPTFAKISGPLVAEGQVTSCAFPPERRVK